MGKALRWLTSHTQASRVRGLIPGTRVVSVADRREADIFELFERGRQQPTPCLNHVVAKSP
jgi:hypothetical protein